MTSRAFDIAVIGGGLVGAAIAFGLRDAGARLALLDEGDVAHRAARGNFGLIWVQGKGRGLSPYGAWTQQSAREWPRLASVLRAETGIDVALRQTGGLHVCLTREELDARTRMLESLQAQDGFPTHAIEFLDRTGIAARLPHIGPDVAGGTWCALDGDCNPLRLLRALHAAIARTDGAVLSDHGVQRIEAQRDGFTLHTERGVVTAAKIVLAAGLGNARLAPMVGIAMPVTPNQGQVLVLERVAPFLPFPLETIRQTDDGTVLIGDAQRDAGHDETLDPEVMAAMAARATRVLPLLRDVRVNRAWAALRVMSPDGFPIYAQSRTHPGAFAATCHSGVTLAAAHAFVLGPALRDGALPAALDCYSPERFDVRAPA